MVTSFVVIENTPGYLPEEDDPYVTDDYLAAVAYMNARVAEYVEFIEETGAEAEVSQGWASPNNYAAVMVYDKSREHDLGRYFGVEIDEEEDDV
jgi:hypothetical protein